MKRREFLKLSVGAASLAALLPEARAHTPPKEIRIGYQKTGVLVITRQQAVLEKNFAARQIGIKWIEFTSGPPLLEAMQQLLERVWHDQGFTAILVTHDVAEAVALADRVLVIEDGQIAHDIAVDIPRPRRRGSADLAALEGSILRNLLKSSDDLQA